MCGIAGWVKYNTKECAAALVKEMARSLAHRGPDDEGFFFGEGVAFGHRRLSIIDLKHGHQPMITRDGRNVIIYNGEVYNYKILKSELESVGETFSTKSDTEVVLNAFRYWGMDAFDKFRGMFAIAIWDSIENMLYLARDHLGIKPLYYVELDEEFIFASEIKALFLHPYVKRKMDPQIVASFLAFNNTFGHKSFWDGIKRCQPGEIIIWNNGNIKRHQFFNISTLEVEPFKGDFNKAACKYRELLEESVEDHMISDVPVGSYLSGGIDSSSVASLAALKTENPISVFTGYFKGFENSWYDERPAARVISNNKRMIHYECPITWSDFSENFNKMSYFLDEPTLGSGAIPQFNVARAASKIVKVILTGHGGDELFAGYPVFKAVLMRQKGIIRCSLKSLNLKSIDEFIRIVYFLMGFTFNPIVARGQFQMFSYKALKRISSIVILDVIRQSGGIEGLLSNIQPFYSKPDIDGVTRWYIATYLPTLLIQEDKISMAHGLEARVPICYKNIVEFSISLSGDIKLSNNELKAVPREGMRSILPGSIYSFPKRGFPTPIIGWLKKDLGYTWEECWRSTLPSPIDGLLNKKGIFKEFKTFRMWGHKLPNAYALAHRLVSLQMLFSCTFSLNTIRPVKDFYLTKDEIRHFQGTSVL